MNCEEEVLVVTGMNNRWFHRVKPASLFLSKMKKYFLLAQGWTHSYVVSQLFVGEVRNLSALYVTMAHGNQRTE